ncbi:MAG: hypothetical protein WCJ30_10905, partial [Deltaproteobacteria bacterium]
MNPRVGRSAPILSVLALFTATSACRRSQPVAPPQPAVATPAAAPMAVPIAAPGVTPPPSAPVLAAPPAGAAVALPAGAPQGQPVPPAQVAAQDQTVGTLTLTSSNPVLYRWSDGDWIFRVTYAVRNTGTAPVDIDRTSFRLADWNPWGNATSFPEHATVNPGLTVDGTIAWFLSSAQPQPTAATVAYAPGEGE